MKFKSKEEAQETHVTNYRSDGIEKAKGTRYASDYLRVSFVVDQVADNSRVLDVGCNGGTIGVRLLSKGCHVSGIDIVSELVEKAKKRGIFADIGEAEDLSRYKDNTFDFVICAEVLEHLYDPLPAINEAFRVLKKGGAYIVTVPHNLGRMCSNDKLGDYHQQNFTLDILDTLFHQCFERENVTFFEIPYVQEYCRANRIGIDEPQWFGLVAVK